MSQSKAQIDQSSMFCNFCCYEFLCISSKFRVLAREKFGVLGNGKDDCLLATFCTLCSNVQVQRQWDDYLEREYEEHHKKQPCTDKPQGQEMV